MKSIETIWGNILLGEIKVGSSHVVNNSMVYFGALMWEFEDLMMEKMDLFCACFS